MYNTASNSIEQALALFSIQLTADLTPELSREVTLKLTNGLNSSVKRHLVNDSRRVKKHDVFCAIVGSQQDGRQYIERAIENGAALVLSQCLQASEHGNVKTVTNTENRVVPIIQFYQLDFHLFELSKSFYQAPQDKLTMIGITGTNGKTTTSQLIAKLLEACQQSCAVIGTSGAGKLNNLQVTDNTTPGATETHQLLAEFIENNITHVAMEVSSHALSQHRVTADLFDIAVFTNLSRDHLDYHESMANYAQAKYQLFSQDESQVAIINGDDRQAQKWLETWANKNALIVYGKSKSVKNSAKYVQAINVVHNSQGVTFTLATHLGNIEINSALIGGFNVDNLLAAIAVLIVLDYSLLEISNAVAITTAINGRMESFSREGKATTVVDYAHTPDGLTNALTACRQHCLGDLWLVFGCGGDRDKGKRAVMGEIAEQQADHVVITNDNPRNEIPESIANDILVGCKNSHKVTVQLDRQQAILTVLAQAKPEDMVLLAGKGDENAIVIGNEKIPYNERKFVQTYYVNEAVS